MTTQQTGKPPKMTRSESMKLAFQNKEIANLRPETLYRIQHEFAATAIDMYERDHKLGKYALKDMGQVLAQPPTDEQLRQRLTELNNDIHHRFHHTDIEARKQKYDMVGVHLAAAGRYLQKAFRQ